MTKEMTIEIKKPLPIIVLTILTAVFVLEVMLGLRTTISFGDEGFHTRLAQWIAEEREIPEYVPFVGSDLERGGFHRPPLWNILEGSFFFIFGVSDVVPKVLTPFVALVLGISTFVLARKVFDEMTSFFSTIITITAPAIVTYSVLYYVDMLFTLYLNAFFLTLILAVRDKNSKYWIISSIFGSLAILTKAPGLAVFPIFGLLFIYEIAFKRKDFKFNNYLVAGVMIFLLTATFFIRNYAVYGDFLCREGYSVSENNICNIDNFENKYEFEKRTTEEGTEIDIFRFGLMNYIMFAYGSVWLIIFGLIAGVIMFIMGNKGEAKVILFAVFLTLFVFILPSSTLRAEDTSRYTLGWLPIIAVISGLYFSEAYRFIKSHEKDMAIMKFVALIVILYVGFFAYKNFSEKLIGLKPVKTFSNSFFQACNFIKQNTSEDALLLTVWSYRTAYNCQRSAVGSVADIELSKDLNYTLDVAKMLKVTHIFIQKFSLSQSEDMSEKYPISFVQFMEDNPAHFVKIYENGPPLNQCLTQGLCDGNIVYEIKY